jgi:hypothetical protein
MGWNYRVMRHVDLDSEGTAHETLSIHEVYYKDDLVPDVLVQSGDVGYTENPVAPVAEDLEGLRVVLTQMLKALDKPALDYN